MSSTDVNDPGLFENKDSAANTNNETKIILAVVCLLAMVAIGSEVWFHFSRENAIKKADALRAELTAQVPVKTTETDQALLLPTEQDPIAPSIVPAVTTVQSATGPKNERTDQSVTSRSSQKMLMTEPNATIQAPNVPVNRSQPTQRIVKRSTSTVAVQQHHSKTLETKAIADQAPSASVPPAEPSPLKESDPASGLPPVADRTDVIASARTGEVKKEVKPGAARSGRNSISGRTVWEQLRNDFVTKGGKADLCSEAARSLNQCP